MALILTTPPSGEPISLAEAKAHLRLYISDDDAYVSTLIIAARRAIESRYGINIMQQSWSLFSDTWPADGIFHLPLWPVVSVESLTSFADDDTPVVIDPAHYYLDQATRPPRLALRRGRIFAPPGRKINGLKLNFTTGFAGQVPQEIKQALLAVVADWYQHRGDENGGTIPATALELLSAYRNVRLS